MNWLISLLATVIVLISSWMYGNKSRRAPMLALVGYLVWIYYVIEYNQWPLLIPTTLNMVIQLRNLIKMRGELT